jgi:hypothetical protein
LLPTVCDSIFVVGFSSFEPLLGCLFGTRIKCNYGKLINVDFFEFLILLIGFELFFVGI